MDVYLNFVSTVTDAETVIYAEIQTEIKSIIKAAGADILHTDEANVYYDVGTTQLGEKHRTIHSQLFFEHMQGFI